MLSFVREREGRLTEEEKKKIENAVKPGRPPGWLITFLGVLFSPHSLWSILGAFGKGLC